MKSKVTRLSALAFTCIVMILCACRSSRPVVYTQPETKVIVVKEQPQIIVVRQQPTRVIQAPAPSTPAVIKQTNTIDSASFYRAQWEKELREKTVRENELSE